MPEKWDFYASNFFLCYVKGLFLSLNWLATQEKPTKKKRKKIMSSCLQLAHLWWEAKNQKQCFPIFALGSFI